MQQVVAVDQIQHGFAWPLWLFYQDWNLRESQPLPAKPQAIIKGAFSTPDHKYAYPESEEMKGLPNLTRGVNF